MFFGPQLINNLLKVKSKPVENKAVTVIEEVKETNDVIVNEETKDVTVNEETKDEVKKEIKKKNTQYCFNIFELFCYTHKDIQNIDTNDADLEYKKV